MSDNTVYLPGSALRPGYVVRNHGYRWCVTAVAYDICGNMGSVTKPHPRYVVNAIPADDKTRQLPTPYHDMSMGLSTDADWCVEIPKEVIWYRNKTHPGKS